MKLAGSWCARRGAVAGVVGLVVSVCATAGMGQVPAAEGPVTFLVPGGPTVIYQRVRGTAHVAIEEIHPIGLIHDPAGVAQGTHLVEHLRCMGATASFAAGESFAALSASGLCNAETMGDLTHYDVVVPGEGFERALQVIAERGESLRIDQGVIEREGPRCHAEVDGVLRALRTPGLKFALAAAVQSWRHGLGEAALRSGLGAWNAEAASGFIASTHDVERMTLVIVGDLEAEAVREAVAERFGGPGQDGGHGEGLGVGDAGTTGAIDYASLERDGVVQWDVGSTGVFVVYPPPEGADERLAMTLWMMAAGEVLAGGGVDLALAPSTNSHAYPVGELPIFVYAPVMDGRDGDGLGDPGEGAAMTGESLAVRVEAIAGGATAGVEGARRAAHMLRGTMGSLGQAGYDGGVSMLTPRVGEVQADRLASGNLALQLGLLHHALGEDLSARLGRLLARDDEWWAGVIRASVNADRRRVTRLVPGGV